MKNIFAFIKNHLTIVLLVLVVLYVIFPKKNPITPYYESSNTGFISSVAEMPMRELSKNMVGIAPVQDSAGAPMDLPASERKTIQDFNIEATVQSVSKTIKSVETKTESFGGFVISSNIYGGKEGENGMINIRIPKEKKSEFLSFIQKEVINIVNESASGEDVTDNYFDIQKRVEILEKNKARFEQIMLRAEDVNEILRVQREIFNLQSQIDSFIGQKQYIEKTSATVKYSISLSTDAYAFSYLPKDGWNALSIFKEAVRSLVLTLRGFGTNAIWILVYGVIWLPIVLVIIFVYRKYWRH